MAPMTDLPDEARKYLSEIGRKGGKAGKGKTGVVKGFAAMTPEERKRASRKGVRARQKKNTKKS
jgi:hypothetical protein